MMLVGYLLGISDSKSFMITHDSSVPKCPGCGYRLDFFAHNPRYRLKANAYDLCATYDGQRIASLEFKRFCEREGYPGLRFLEFNSDELHFHFIVENIVPFDAIRRGTRFENMCQACCNYESVVGAAPAFLQLKEPLSDGIFRSDLLFASGNEKTPALFVGIDTRAKIEAARLRGIHFEPALGLQTER